MMKFTSKILIGLVFTLTFGCSENSSCKTEKDIIIETIDAINQKNTKAYIALFDFDKISEIWQEAGETDQEYKDFLNAFQNKNEEIIKMYSSSYNTVIGKIEKIYNIKNYHFDLVDYKLLETQKETNFISEKFRVRLTDNYNNNWNLDIFISKYKDSYLITEPIEMNFIEKIEK